MNINLFRNCFLVGASAASAVGPIFVLIFNRGATYGFRRGFETAIGAALGDGVLFGLSMLGILQVLETSKKFLIAMDLVVSILLIYLGIRMFRKHQRYLSDSLDYEESFWLTIGRSFLLTIVNPLTIFFFMFISVRIMPENISRLAPLDFIIASLMLSLGSLATFSLVSFAGKMLGHTLERKQLFIASYLTGLIFIGMGLYFSFDFVKLVIQSFL
jgi:threonine/homoserine/homoserine lactone efflux protein